MKTGVASTLPMLSLGVLLLVAGISTAAVSDDAIRLPSDGAGFADLFTAMTRAARGDGNKRPWKCCDLAACTRSRQPMCRCVDTVDRCSDACKDCRETADSRHACADWFRGNPGPRCKEDDDDAGLADPGAMFSETAATAGKLQGDDETRPWKCCDLQVCTKSWPPVCHCWDEVERCARTCKRCEEVEGGSSPRCGRYRCLDPHRGDPGPRCSRQGGMQ